MNVASLPWSVDGCIRLMVSVSLLAHVRLDGVWCNVLLQPSQFLLSFTACFASPSDQCLFSSLPWELVFL